MIAAIRKASPLVRRARSLRSGFAVACLALAATALGQVGTFDSGSDESDGALFVKGTLAPVEGFAAAYDAARGEVVAFGGDLFSPFGSGDIDHSYTFDGVSWRRVAQDAGPDPRESPAMAYDSSRQQVVLFGGDSGENDTWLWNGAAWTEAAPATSPPNANNAQHAMAFDAARGLITLVLRDDFASEELETWTWDGANWTQQAATLPHDNDFKMVYDPGLQKIALLARVPSDGMQTWVWDGAAWTLLAIDPLPFTSFSSGGDLVYDGRVGATAFYGQDKGFRFDGTDWASVSDAVPAAFKDGVEELVYDPGLNAVLRLNGLFHPEGGGSQRRNATVAWNSDGSVETLTEGSFVFDMTGRPSGVWHFTTIEIGPNVIVSFEGNAENTPLRWLASGDVVIEGTLDLSGRERRHEDGLSGLVFGLGGFGGPGGYDGASSAPLGSNLRSPGNGPGGGFFTGAQDSEDGEFASYGNSWLYPLVGGSGGGTLGSNVGGGGGGGAALIASSGDLTLNVAIVSLGQEQPSSIATGSGGAVLLRANRLLGDGDIDVGEGRKRLEGWETPLADSIAGLSELREVGPPLLPVELGASPPKLWVDSVNGVTVANPPVTRDSLVEPDVVFSSGGPVQIVVKGANVPIGAEVTLFISLADDSVIEAGPAVFNGAQAVFNVTLPDGFGAIAAEARFPFEN